MRTLQRLGRATLVLGVFGIAAFFALNFGTNGLFRGLEAAPAVVAPGQAKAPYDPNRLTAVHATLDTIKKKYVEPDRIKPKAMFLGAVDAVQREIAQVIVTHEDKSPTVKVQVETESKDFRVDDIQGPWDVEARLTEVFRFLQANLQDAGVDLRKVEYAACNGLLRTLDPHSNFLSPDAYREMNLSTSGHFGGLGIVISVRDQLLTVMRPMPDTPAGRAGLKRLDRILKINNESTQNMPLDDAVGRLRGEPGTKVTIWVRRDGTEGWQGTRPFELTREEIRVRSVTSQALGNGVGYARIEQFQASTSDELTSALTELGKKERLAGLVLDLRGNPGGLLDQAAKVADVFIDDGVLVSTVGASEGREVKRATRGNTPNYPVVVLINGSSASASEIVAGALKNSNRAVVVGQASFGKGSVQLVFPRVTPENAALKLTIAQYLTPGDISIQGTGVSPDVELDPMTADQLEMDLFRGDNAGLKERDLTKSLSSGGRRSTEQPFFKLRYNLPEKERAQLRELGSEADDEFRLDFPVRFARDLVSKLGPAQPRPEALRAAKAFLDKAQETEVTAVAADLAALGVDWSAPSKGAVGTVAGDFQVTVGTDRPKDTVQAGQPMTLSVTVKNNGKGAVHQLRAVTQSDGPYWTERELAFGKLGPGESKTATVPFGWCEIEGKKLGSTAPLPTDAKRKCKLPLGAITRADVVKIRFSGEGGEPPKDAELRPTVEGLSDPIFAYAYQVADNRPGNGDGQLARGEGATIYLTVKNVGKGKSYETTASLRNLTGDGLFLHAGRFDLSNMQPGESRSVAFSFDVLQQLADDKVNVELRIADADLGVVANEKLAIPVTRQAGALSAAMGKVTAAAATPMRAQPLASSPEVAQLAAGSVAERLGTSGEFTKIKIEGDRFAFVETRSLVDSTAPVKLTVTPTLSRSPPMLEVSTSALSTSDDHVVIEATATDGDRVLDAYVFVGGRKVYYQSNRKAQDQKKLALKYDVKLKPGTNVITVVARENEDTATRYTRVVRRDGKNGEALPSPKGDDSFEDFGFVAD
jgi:carboxyl-terminal processing protease